MKTSDLWIEQLIKFEGCRLKAYKDIAGVPTIGIGHTGKDVQMGMTITMDRAKELLKSDLTKAENYVNSFNDVLKGALTQNQFDALVDIVYNCGSGAIRTGTTIRKVLMKSVYDVPAITNAFMLWCKVTDPVTKKKVVSKGLEKRRAVEAAWFVFGSNYAEITKQKKIVDLVQWART